MIALKNNVTKLNALLKDGKIREAFERYYSGEVMLQVNGTPAIIGNDQKIKRETIFLAEIEKLNNAEIRAVTFGGTDNEVSMTEWAINIENKFGEQKLIYRVNVQHWKKNKIIYEKVYFCGDQKF